MKKYDLIVVGGGILGIFHAYHALKNGKRVLLLEKDGQPAGATVRNFGQVIPSGMPGEWFDHGVRGLEIYRSIQREFDISVRKNGTIYLASDEDEQRLIHELKAHYDAQGYEASLGSKKKTLQKFPAVRPAYVREALFFPQEISVEPPLLARRLQEYLGRKFAGFTGCYQAPVLACKNTRGGVVVVTADQKPHPAEKAVICNGSEFKLLYPDIFRRCGLRVCKLQMMQTIPLPGVKMAGNILSGLSIRRYESFTRNCPGFSKIKTPERYAELKKRGIHLLFKQAVDGSIIIGDSHEYADPEHADGLGFKLDQSIDELMLREAGQIVRFDVRQIGTRWAGFYAQPEGKQILEFDVGKNIHVRTGIGGKGMTCSAGYAEKSIQKIFNLA